MFNKREPVAKLSMDASLYFFYNSEFNCIEGAGLLCSIYRFGTLAGTPSGVIFSVFTNHAEFTNQKVVMLIFCFLIALERSS